MGWRKQEPYFPSFTLVLTQAQHGSKLSEHRSSRVLRYRPHLDCPSRVIDRLMMTVDYRSSDDHRGDCWFISIDDDAAEMDKSDVESDSSVDDTFRHHHDWFSISKWTWAIRLKLHELRRNLKVKDGPRTANAK